MRSAQRESDGEPEEPCRSCSAARGGPRGFMGDARMAQDRAVRCGSTKRKAARDAGPSLTLRVVVIVGGARGLGGALGVGHLAVGRAGEGGAARSAQLNRARSHACGAHTGAAHSACAGSRCAAAGQQEQRRGQRAARGGG
jgi:hypothetical protein